MKTFYLYVKSHTEAPDLEEEVQAKNVEEAVETFYKMLGKYGWSRGEIMWQLRQQA